MSVCHKIVWKGNVCWCANSVVSSSGGISLILNCNLLTLITKLLLLFSVTSYDWKCRSRVVCQDENLENGKTNKSIQAQTEDWCTTLGSLPSALILSLSISKSFAIYRSSCCSVLPPLILWFLNEAHTTSRDWDRTQWHKIKSSAFNLLLLSWWLVFLFLINY